MSRFVQAELTRWIEDTCRCVDEGETPPHPLDRVEIVSEVLYGVVGQVSTAGHLRNPAIYNRFDANQKLLELTVRSWNLVGPEGKDMPVNAGTIALLDESTIEWIAREVNKGYRPAVLPKGKRGR